MEIPHKHNIRNCIHCNKRMSCNIEYEYDTQTGLFAINIRPYHDKCKELIVAHHKKVLEVEALEQVIQQKRTEVLQAGWDALSLKFC